MKAHALMLLLVTVLAQGCRASDQSAPPSQTAPSAQTADETPGKESLREEVNRRARERNGGKEPTKLELFNEFARKAYEETGAAKAYGKPRIVARGAKPEIIIRGDQILIDGKPVMIGAPIDLWKDAFSERPICYDGSVRILCVWTNLGVAVATQSAENTAVLDLTIYQNLETREPWNPRMPDGSTMAEPPDYRPKRAFPGYLQLDGFGIDARTEFWEIRESADPERKLRCGSNDCSHPHGGFSDKASLYLRLNSASERGNVYEFSISGYEK